MIKHGFGSITGTHSWIPPSHLLCVILILLAPKPSLITGDDLAQDRNQAYWNSLETLSFNTVMNCSALVGV